MATLCIRPTDCLAGRAFFGAHRGARLAPPAPSSRRPMQQKLQGSQIPATDAASPAVAVMQPRPARAQATNGRQRRRRSPPAAVAGSGSPPPPHSLVMENVVILKRGEPIPPVATVALPPAGPSLAQAEEAEAVVAIAEEVKPVAVEGHSRAAQADSAEPVAAAGQRGPEAQEKKAEEAAEHLAGDEAKAAPPAVAAPSVPQAKKETKQQASMAAAKPEVYAGSSFATAAPDPSELPIPPRGRAPRTIRASGGGLAPVTVAAAA
nr:unnamed protein product [Digitaria exilis]